MSSYSSASTQGQCKLPWVGKVDVSKVNVRTPCRVWEDGNQTTHISTLTNSNVTAKPAGKEKHHGERERSTTPTDTGVLPHSGNDS